MADRETPLQAVKRMYGSKDKLVDQVVAALGAAGDEANELKQRIARISNRKLLRLAEVGKTIKDKYGSKDKLAEAVAAAYGRTKDADYVAKLQALSPARLLDMARARGA